MSPKCFPLKESKHQSIARTPINKWIRNLPSLIELRKLTKLLFIIRWIKKPMITTMINLKEMKFINPIVLPKKLIFTLMNEKAYMIAKVHHT